MDMSDFLMSLQCSTISAFNCWTLSGVVGEGVDVVPSPRISSSSSLASSWEYGIVGVTISLGIGCSSRFWDPVASMGLLGSMVLLYGDKVWFRSGVVSWFLLPIGGFGLVLVTVLPENSSANLLLGQLLPRGGG